MAQNKKKTSGKSGSGNKKTTQKPAAKKTQNQKSGGKRTTSTASKGQSRAKQNTSKQAENEVTYYGEIILWIIAGICIFLFLSSFGICGKVGNTISGFFFGVFGIIQFIMPFVFFFACAFLVSNAFHFQAVKKVCYTFLLSIFVSAFFQMFVSMEPESAKAAFEYSKSHKWGGGFFGGGIVKFLSEYLGIAGTFLVVIIAIIIFTVLAMEKSVAKVMHTGSQKVVEGAKKLQTSLEEESARNELERARAKKGKKDLYHSMKVYETAEPEEEKSTKGILGKRKSKAAIEEITMEYELEENPKKESRNGMEVSSKAVDRAPSIFDKFEQETTKELEPIVEAKEEKSKPEENEWKETVVEKTKMVELQEEDTFTESEEEAREVLKKLKPKEKISEKDQILNKKTIEKKVTTQQDAIPTAPRPTKNVERENAEKVTFTENANYKFPPLSLLAKSQESQKNDISHIRQTAQKLQQTLENFGVKVTVTDYSCGPTVTRYELQPEPGTKVSKIVSLTDDIKLNLAAADIRMEAPIPGKSAIGIEVPNKENLTVFYRDLIETDDFRKHPSNIAFAVGKDIAGKTIVADIAKMPHLLIAGQTGSGKSVCINTLIMSILYKAHPDDVKLIMIDPKVVELSVYNGIPHLLIPVVSDPKKAAGALNWAVAEMTERYQKFSDYGVRNLKGYNQKVEEVNQEVGEESQLKKLPEIVIIVDELADLMMVAPGEVEDAIVRLTQLARAAGIHLVIATQRPSVNVITGLIKANVPSRIAFAVSQGVDSRTIIDMNGAEKLLGKGDMLFFPSGFQKPVRVQGAFVSDKEVGDVVEYIKSQNEVKKYSDDISAKITQVATSSSGKAQDDDRDEYFIEAAKFIIEKEKASIGMLQRVYKIGFNRAARIMDQLAEAGVVGPEEGTKPRKILMTMDEFMQMLESE
ncbi:MAG: DNA translocase FtsK [Lachnospiraceae bacterium]|nr:DNA translocase FtsK [Lachnospiraceae bacterium]